ncbi:MAG: ATP-binding protein [Ahniella sp.]|nr:ATP-binding protein [Ahniella sp.]
MSASPPNWKKNARCHETALPPSPALWTTHRYRGGLRPRGPYRAVAEPPSQGALNFVVGVNGSGKSSLLRALYRIFRSLNRRERPDLPVTLAWDRRQGGADAVTAILHYDNVDDAASFFVTVKPVPIVARRSDWEGITAALSNGDANARVLDAHVVRGSDAFASSLLAAQLPKRLIAYTSGADGAWLQLGHPTFRPQNEDKEQYQREGERPPGWGFDKEWESEQPVRMSNILTRFPLRSSTETPDAPSVGQLGVLSIDVIERIQKELAPLSAIREKLFTNHATQADRLDDSCFRIQVRHLRYAGITLGLWQAAKEMANQTEIGSREALRKLLLQQRGADSKTSDARRVLNEIDWFWPTHLTLTYRDVPGRASAQQHRELLCLVALADEVIEQPRGRQRAVFSLGPSNRISLTEKLSNAFSLGIPGQDIERTADRVDGSRLGRKPYFGFSAPTKISTPRRWTSSIVCAIGSAPDCWRTSPSRSSDSTAPQPLTASPTTSSSPSTNSVTASR